LLAPRTRSSSRRHPGNQTGIALVTEPGTELLLEANAHLVHSEVAGVAALSGVQIRPITTPDGLLTPELVRGMIRAPSPHVPRTTALAIENTHNTAGGRVLNDCGGRCPVRLARASRMRSTWMARACGTPRSPWACLRPVWHKAPTP